MKKLFTLMTIVFGFSLAAQAQDKNEKTPFFPNLVCFGTEPFWDLKINPKGIKFRNDATDPENSWTRLAVVDPAPANGFTIQHARIFKTLDQNKGRVTILIKEENCSDDMSEEVHPMSVMYMSDLVGNFSGCCRILK